MDSSDLVNQLFISLDEANQKVAQKETNIQLLNTKVDSLTNENQHLMEFVSTIQSNLTTINKNLQNSDIQQLIELIQQFQNPPKPIPKDNDVELQIPQEKPIQIEKQQIPQKEQLNQEPIKPQEEPQIQQEEQKKKPLQETNNEESKELPLSNIPIHLSSINLDRPNNGIIQRNNDQEEIPIYYCPKGNEAQIAEDDEVYLLGEFTSWEMIKLNKQIVDQQTIYAQKFKLDSGFKYRFTFLINGQIMIDNNWPVSVNKVGKKTNYLVVTSIPEEELGELDLTKTVSYIDKRMSSEERKGVFSPERVKKMFEDKKIVNEEEKKIEDTYNDIVKKGEIFFFTEHPTGIFKIIEIFKESQMVRIQRLVDQNNISLDNENYISKNTMDYGIGDFFTKFIKFSDNEEEIFLKELENSFVFLKWKKEIDEADTSKSYCIPIELRPEFLSINDYEIGYDNVNHRIIKIQNKSFGPVKFKSENIDEACGFIENSIMMLYSTVLPNGVYNLIHSHINDTSNSVPLDLAYMSPEEPIEKFQKFEKDASGTMLRYRILVQKDRIDRIYYNTGSQAELIPFEEIQFRIGEIIKLDDIEQAFPVYLKISHIPVQMLCSENNELIGKYKRGTAKNPKKYECFMRTFVELPGLIDCEVILEEEKIPPHPKPFSLPICLCQKISEEEESKIQKIYFEEEKKVENEIQEMLNLMEAAIQKYDANKNKLTEVQIQDILNILTKNEAKLNVTIESADISPALQEKIQQITQESVLIIRRLANELRFIKLKKNKQGDQ